MCVRACVDECARVNYIGMCSYNIYIYIYIYIYMCEYVYVCGHRSN